MEIDRITAAQLGGGPVDLRELVLATESLSKLVAPEGTGTDVDFETRHRARCQEEFAGAREALSNLLTDQSERLDARDRHDSPGLRAEIVALKTALAEKDALIEQLRAAPGAREATSPTPSPSDQTSNQPPLPPASSASPPANYLRKNDGFDVIQGGRFDRRSNRG